jgi:hypothetical protein
MQENFSPEDSLHLIQAMIDKTKANISENRFYFLFWGWITFLAVLLQFLLKVVLRYPHHYLVWLVTIPAAVITMWYARKHQGSGTRTYVGDSMSHLWTGVGISFGVLSFIISQSPSGWYYAFPYFILFYGLGTFISGLLLQFRPLVIGGIVNWVLACVCALIPYDYQLLLTGAALLVSYIIPGHMIQPAKRSL